MAFGIDAGAAMSAFNNNFISQGLSLIPGVQAMPQVAAPVLSAAPQPFFLQPTSPGMPLDAPLSLSGGAQSLIDNPGQSNPQGQAQGHHHHHHRHHQENGGDQPQSPSISPQAQAFLQARGGASRGFR